MNARQKRQEKNLSIYDICLELHMSNSGSSDPLDKKIHNFYITNLIESLDQWTDSLKFTKIFDDSVKELIKATLLEDLIRNKNEIKNIENNP